MSRSERILECLEGTLDGLNQSRREGATRTLEQLGEQPGFCVELLRLALNDNGIDIEIKQYAVVHLKNVMMARWTDLSKLYKEGSSVIKDDEKIVLRKELPRGLSHPHTKLRNACAHALASIGAWDWPEHWSTFATDLVKCLRSTNSTLAVGALSCLTYFTRSGKLEARTFPKLVPAVVPAMLQLYQSVDKFPPAVRQRALPISNACIEGLLILRGGHKKQADEMLKKTVAPWLPYIEAALKRKETVEDIDCREKIYALSTLHLLLSQWTQQMVPYLPKLLPGVFQSIVSSAAVYQRAFVDADLCQRVPTDEDGNTVGLPTEIIYLLDLLRILIEFKTLRKVLYQQIGNILFFVVSFMQITVEDEEQWEADTDEFVASEDDYAEYTQGLRPTAMLLLTELFERAQRDNTLVKTAGSFAQAVKKHCTDGSSSWKIIEASMHAVGLVHKQLLRANKINGTAVFDLPWFFNSLLKPAIQSAPSSSSSSSSGSSVFLKVRALWALGRLSDNIPQDNIKPFLAFTVQVLQGRSELPLKVGACLALLGFLPKLSAEVVRPLLAKVVPSLCSLLAQVPPNTLHLVLQTLYQALRVEQVDPDNFVTTAVVPIAKSIIKIWSRYHNDPNAAEDIVYIFSALSKALEPGPEKHREVVGPVLVSILSQSPDKNPSLTTSALDVLEAIMTTATAPLSRLFIDKLFLLVIRIGMTTDSQALAQTVSSVLACFVHADSEQLASARFLADQRSGTLLVMQYAQRMLTDAKVPDHALGFLDALLVQMLVQPGFLADDAVKGMLKATLQKLYKTTFTTVRQSMLFVFVRLFASNPIAVLKVLSQIQMPDGSSAVPAILCSWLKMHTDFLGVYRQKISCMAMVNLLKLNDPRVNSITVPHELLVNLSEGRQSRSSKGGAKLKEQYSQIPLPAKITKVLVQEHQQRLDPEDEFSNSDDSEEAEYDDYEDDEEDEGGDQRSSPFAPAEEYEEFLEELDDDENDDDVSPEIDPLNQIDFVPFLAKNLITIYSTPALSSLVGPSLTADERDYIAGLESQ